MKSTEHSAKSSSSSKTGFFASLCAALSAKGTRAPSFGRTVVALLAVPAAVLITAARALAAAPEIDTQHNPY